MTATAGRAANGTGGLTRLKLRLPGNSLGARKLPVLPRHLLGVVPRRTGHVLRARELPVLARRLAVDVLSGRHRPGRRTPIRVLRRLPGSHRRTPIHVLRRLPRSHRPGRRAPVRVLRRLSRRHQPGRWNLARRNGTRPGPAAPLNRPRTRSGRPLCLLTRHGLPAPRLTRPHLARPRLALTHLALARLTRPHLTWPDLALARLTRPGRLSAAGRDPAGTVTGPRNHSRGLPGHGTSSPGNRRGPHTLASRHDGRHNGGRPHRPGARNRRWEAARVPGHPRPAPARRRVGTRLIALLTSWGATPPGGAGLPTVTHGAGALWPFRFRYGSAALACTTVPGKVLAGSTRSRTIASPCSAAALSCFAAAMSSGALVPVVLAAAAVPTGGLARSVLAAAVPPGGLLRPGITRPAARERHLTGRPRHRPTSPGTTKGSPTRRTGDRTPAEGGATRRGSSGTRVVEFWAARRSTPGTWVVEARGTRNRTRRARRGLSGPEVAVAGARDRVRAVAAETVAAAHGAAGGNRA
ncbi:MAG: hypothetical protein SYR96_00220 [Actinomycetota bacterium]|nr:hypothetical protein [Actinomycetota bacterium]